MPQLVHVASGEMPECLDPAGFQFASHDDLSGAETRHGSKAQFVVGQNFQMGGSSCGHKSLSRPRGLQFALKGP